MGKLITIAQEGLKQKALQRMALKGPKVAMASVHEPSCTYPYDFHYRVDYCPEQGEYTGSRSRIYRRVKFQMYKKGCRKRECEIQLSDGYSKLNVFRKDIRPSFAEGDHIQIRVEADVSDGLKGLNGVIRKRIQGDPLREQRYEVYLAEVGKIVTVSWENIVSQIANLPVRVGELLLCI